MSNPRRYLWLPVLAVSANLLLVVACRGSDKRSDAEGVTGEPARPRLELTAAPGELSACPGATGAFLPLTLSNLGDAPASLSFVFEGAGKEAFSIPEGRTPPTLAPGATVELPVHFTPRAPGPIEATLVVEDGLTSTPPVRYPLSGTGLALPSAPSVQVLPASASGAAPEACDVFGLCRLAFSAVFFGRAQTLELEVRNGGCTPLQVTGLELTKGPAGGENLAFFVDAPALLPSEGTPWRIPAGARNGRVLQVRFQPERDSSESDYREGLLKLSTNDPAMPVLAISLSGEGTAPATYAQPERCNFADPADTCGLPTKNANQARFRVFNTGRVDAQITATIDGEGASNFTLLSAVQQAHLPANGHLDLEVRYDGAAAATYVAGRLLVRAAVDGVPAGDTVIALGGGVAPRLGTEPAHQLDFTGAVGSTRTVQISNGPGAGTLVLHRITLEDSTHFSLVNPPPPGTTVPPGTSVSFDVRYSKPAAGGTQAAVLRIETNDPAFEPPAHKVLTLVSEAPLDHIPVAGAQVRARGASEWSGTPYTQSLLALEGPDKLLELTCDGSHDPQPPGAPKRVAQCEFRLVKKPRLATQTTLDFDGERIDAYPEGEPAVVRLRLTPNVVGQYQVDVYAYDNAGQRSSQPVRLLIHAAP